MSYSGLTRFKTIETEQCSGRNNSVHTPAKGPTPKGNTSLSLRCVELGHVHRSTQVARATPQMRGPAVRRRVANRDRWIGGGDGGGGCGGVSVASGDY